MANIVDLSQVIISGCHIELADALKKKNPENRGLIKHMALASLLKYKQLGKATGQMILACDGGNYWRKSYFPYYKGHRDIAKADSPLDWDTIYDVVNEIKTDLKQNFPYKVIDVPGAEADDVIAVLTKYFQTNELVSEGLFDGEPQPIIIFSSDNDFIQLQKYKGVKQWSILLKKWVKPKMSVQKYLAEHICTGDAGDNIPNICTGDEWAKARSNGESTRASSFMQVRLDSFVEKGIDACVNEKERVNYARNKTLIDFESIPADIEKKIIDAYITQSPQGSKMKIMNYLVRNRMKLLMQNLNDF